MRGEVGQHFDQLRFRPENWVKSEQFASTAFACGRRAFPPELGDPGECSGFAERREDSQGSPRACEIRAVFKTRLVAVAVRRVVEGVPAMGWGPHELNVKAHTI